MEEVANMLIVAADYSPKENGGASGVREKVLELGQKIAGSGVIIKVNSVLRACGYGLIQELHDLGLQVFADLKLIDIPATMQIDAEMLLEYKPEFVTVMCCAGIAGMARVQEALGQTTHVLGVTVLTSLDEEECQGIFVCSCKAGVLRLARMAKLANLEGLILSSQEAEMISKKDDLHTLSLNTPGIRPTWSVVKADDQKRIMTPAMAIKSGVDRIVVGRPITQAKDPMVAVTETLEEIQQGLEER